MSRPAKPNRRAPAGKRPIRRLGAPLQPHARLLDAEGAVVAGGGLRDRDWLMLLGGRVVATTDSAAMLLAMLRHTQRVAGAGRDLRLEASPQLLRAADEEAALHGHPLEEYLALLERERAERGADDPPLH